MKKLIVIALLSIGLTACGDPGTGGVHSDSHYKITCYSGGKEILNVPDATGVENNNYGLRFKTQDKYLVVTADCVSERK